MEWLCASLSTYLCMRMGSRILVELCCGHGTFDTLEKVLLGMPPERDHPYPIHSVQHSCSNMT